MRRNALTLFAGSFLLGLCVITLAGCSLFQKKEATLTAESYDPAYTDLTYADVARDSGTSSQPPSSAYGDPYASSYNQSYTPPAPAASYETSYDASPARSAPKPNVMASAGGQYHTVARRDTLFSLARSYYGDERRWREIYRANQDSISDPNKIYVGQRILIP